VTQIIAPETTRRHEPAVYRFILRLHFYAGLLVAPFLLILSITGAIYLFNTEIEDARHPEWRFVQAAGVHLPPEQIVAGALAAYPAATPTRVDLPVAADRTAVVFLTPTQGEPFRVYVDPVSAEARGSFIYTRTLVGFADTFHGSLMLGDKGDAIVELAACWAILLVATGLFLWWPRGAAGIGGTLYPRFYLRRRAFWRDLHAVTGVWISALLLFLLLTGLPWSTLWGTNFNRILTAVGQGYPPAYRTHGADHDVLPVPVDGKKLRDVNGGVPWTLEEAPAPTSVHQHAVVPIAVADAARRFANVGLTTAYRLVYPRNGHDVYTAYTYPDQPQGQRTIHLDQYTGEIINDVSYADYGAGAKAIELGVQLHMGNYFGRANQVLMLLATLGGACLAITGPLMWLRRSRSGLGAPPPLLSRRRAIWGVYAGLAAFALLFPLMGLSLVAILSIERLILARIAPVRTWLGLSA
jgi:uncharacterized iron-regulated membrane protein